jgi:hypothetical protein
VLAPREDQRRPTFHFIADEGMASGAKKADQNVFFACLEEGISGKTAPGQTGSYRWHKNCY